MKKPTREILSFVLSITIGVLGFIFFSVNFIFPVFAVDSIVGASFAWGRTYQSDIFSYDSRGIAVDSQDNVLVVGRVTDDESWTAGEIDLDLSSASYVVSGTSFLAKYSPTGAFLFGFGIGDDGPSLSNRVNFSAVSSDSDNNIYLVGDFSGTVQFDFAGGTDSKTSHDSQQDIFVMKVNADGSYGWTKTFGGDVYDNGFKIAVDQDITRDALYISGYLNQQFPADVIDLDPGGGVRSSTTKGQFISKFDLSGNFEWAYEFGTAYSTFLPVVVKQSTGDVYIDSGNSGGGFQINAFDSTGTLLAFSAGVTGASLRADMVLDENEDIILGGQFEGTLDFDPTGGDDTKSSASLTDEDAYVTKINADGSYGWTRTFGGTARDRGYTIAVDNLNNYYLGGWFQDIVDFDFTGGVDSHSAGLDRAFITMLDELGGYLKTYSFGGEGESLDFSSMDNLVLNSDNVLYAFGGYVNDVDLDPSSGVYMKQGFDNSNGDYHYDMFFSKFLPIYSTGIGDEGTPGVPGETYSNDANLSGITFGDCTLAPVFSSSQTTYVCILDTTNSDTTVIVTSSSADSRITINDYAYESGQTYTMPLDFGTNALTIDLVAEDTVTSKTYTVSVYNPYVDGTYYEYNASVSYGGSGSANITINDSTFDGQDNLYIMGRYTNGPIDLDPGVGEAWSASGTGNFIVKFNDSLVFQWVKFINESNGTRRLAADSLGNVYYGSAFSVAMDVDPSAAVVTLTPVGAKNGYVVKLNSLGEYQWSKTWSEVGSEYVADIVVDGVDNIYVIGELGDIQVNPTISIDKLDSSGNSLWYKSLENYNNASFDDWHQIDIDSNNNVVFGSYVFGGLEIDYDPSEGADIRGSAYQQAYFVSKLNSDGSYGWTKVFDVTDEFSSISTAPYMVVDSSNNIFFSSILYSGGIDMDPGDGDASITSNGGDTTFVLKLDPIGDYLWGKKFDANDDVDVQALEVNDYGDVLIAGNFANQMDLDPSPTVTNTVGPAFSSWDPFFVELSGSGEYLDSWVVLVNAYSDMYDMQNVEFNSEDEMFFVGRFYGEAGDSGGLDFDDDGIAEVTSLGYEDGFIAKFIKTTPEGPPEVPGDEGEDPVSITDLDSNLLGIDVLTDLDVSEPSLVFYGTGREVILYSVDGAIETALANVTVDLDASRSWINVHGDVDLVNRKSVVSGLSTAPGTSGSFYLYVPKNPDDNSAWVCPNITTLEGITTSCSGGYRLSSSLVMATVDGNSYWKIPATSDLGAISYKYLVVIDEEGDDDGTPSTSDNYENLPEEVIVPEEEIVPEEIPTTNPEEEDGEEEKEPIFESISQVYKDVVKFVIDTSKQVKSIFDQSPISEETSTLVATTAISAIATSSGINILLGSTYIQGYILKFTSLILGIFKIKKKKRGYGVVYDSITKEPINGAIIRVYDEKNTLKTTEVTNKLGIFEFYVESGNYKLDVNAANYEFPSYIIQSPSDLPYENIYHGGRFRYESSQEVNFSIPLDSSKGTIAQSVSSGMKNILINVLNITIDILVVAGLLFSINSYIKNPNEINAILLGVYLLIILLNILFSSQSKYRFGKVKDEDGNWVKGVELGLLENEFGRLSAKRVTSEKGEYRFLVAPGEYKLVSLDPEYSLEEDLYFKKTGKGVLAINKNIKLIRRG